MEAALSQKQNNKRWVLTFLFLICMVGLIPSFVVFANALTDPTIGMSGVNDSQLTVGMTGVNNSNLLIDFNASDWHINPSSSVYPVMMAVPLIFFIVALLFILGLAFNPELNIKGVLIVALLIFVALALLVFVNSQTNSLLGG